MPIKLACFDLDFTLLNGRLNHSLEEAGLTGQTADNATIDAHLEKVGGIKNRLALQKTIKDLLKKEVKVAITSFSNHPEAVTRVLERIGLSPEEISQVSNFSFRPDHSQRKANGKNPQLEQAIATFGLQPSEVVLVDDNVNNFDLAKEKGYNVIWVQDSEGNVGYLNELREMAGLSAAMTQPIAPPAPAQVTEPEAGWVDRLLGMLGLKPAQGMGI